MQSDRVLVLQAAAGLLLPHQDCGSTIPPGPIPTAAILAAFNGDYPASRTTTLTLTLSHLRLEAVNSVYLVPQSGNGYRVFDWTQVERTDNGGGIYTHVMSGLKPGEYLVLVGTQSVCKVAALIAGSFVEAP